MAYRPRHQPQLGRGTPVPGRTKGSRDCGPRTWQVGVDNQTQGDVMATIAQLRERGDVEGPQQTNVADAKRAVDSFRKPPKRKPLKYYIKTNAADVKAAVRNGRYVHVCVDYGKFNDLMQKTGDPGFRGGHSVGVKGQKKRRDGVILWLLFDPLDDSRRNTIPAGPRWVPRSKVIAAMRAFGGSRVWAGVFTGGGKR